MDKTVTAAFSWNKQDFGHRTDDEDLEKRQKREKGRDKQPAFLCAWERKQSVDN